VKTPYNITLERTALRAAAQIDRSAAGLHDFAE
jgi:hypothetical protein